MKKDNIQKWALRELLKAEGASVDWTDYDGRTWLILENAFACAYDPRMLHVKPHEEKRKNIFDFIENKDELKTFVPTGMLMKNPKRGGYLHEFKTLDGENTCYIQDRFYKQIAIGDVSFRAEPKNSQWCEMLSIWQGDTVVGAVSSFYLGS